MPITELIALIIDLFVIAFNFKMSSPSSSSRSRSPDLSRRPESALSTEMHRFEQMRAQFEANLTSSIKRSAPPRQMYTQSSDLGGGSILNQSITSTFNIEQINDSKKFRKSVRFQVYDDKTMGGLQKKRQELQENLK